MRASPVPAFRDLVRASAAYLVECEDFDPMWDGPARTWRRAGADGQWRPVRPEVVFMAASDVLDAALSRDDVPLHFRCVLPPPGLLSVAGADAADEGVGSALEAVEAVDTPEALASWQAVQISAQRAEWEASQQARRAERARLEALVAGIKTKTADGQAHPSDWVRRLSAERVLERWTEAAPFTPRPVPLIGAAQRERIRRALSARAIEAAVRWASGDDRRAYHPPGEASDFERSWVNALPRVPGAATLTSSVFAAYQQAAIRKGVVPMRATPFHRIAVEVLGDGDPRACRVKREGRRVYLDLALPTECEAADARPALRLVT